jgi:NADH-quinone oxidoreductase subunit L
MNINVLILPIIIPIAAAGAILLSPKKWNGVKEALALAATFVNMALSLMLFGKEIAYSVPWAGFGISFSLRLYNFSAFIAAATAIFGFLITLYSSTFLSGKDYAKSFYIYLLISLSFVTGAVFSANLILMLFFWEGLLVTLFAMIAIGGRQSFKTATKAFIIVGLCDLCMMVGMALTGHLAGTFEIAKINIPVTGLGGAAFLLLMIGAISKGGSMPFHSWIPDAATDAPLPFMAIFPAALEKLLGIYFLTRITLDIFKLNPNSWLSYTLMTIGALTILLAVMMALVQKDFKRLLSYHAISQLGYMMLGIGTLVPAGIVGGLFHMLNNAMYKSCLFLTGGALEKETGTTDLEKLGGIGSKMPITFACFFVAALAISGVPPFNGFFSKELVYDGALERGILFYLAAVGGSFLTAASFLKLGHAAFLGKLSEKNRGVKEAPIPMLFPMIVIALGCVAFGIFNAFPINKLIQPCIGEARMEGHSFGGFHINIMLTLITIAVLVAALLNHIYGFKKTGKGVGAVDHIHYAPGLAGIYSRAEKGYFDPFNIGTAFVNLFANIMSFIDKAIDWVYNVLSVRSVEIISMVISKAHTGSYKLYTVWSIVAAIAIIVFMLKAVI